MTNLIVLRNGPLATHLGIVLLALAASACGSGGDTPAQPVQAPSLLSVSPAPGTTGVRPNVKLSAVFDTAMDPLGPTTFTLMQGTTAVSGTRTMSADGKTATFAPSANLLATSAFTATIAAGARSAAGGIFAADRTWTFTTGRPVDTTPPIVNSTYPRPDARGVAINTRIAASFSRAMDPLTITSLTFTVKQGDTPVLGSVVYGVGHTATFTAASALASNAPFRATLTTDVKDVDGNSLTSAYGWGFMTGTATATGPSQVLLGSAGNYAILAKTAISTVPASMITGDIGLSPAAASFITAFDLVADSTNVFATSTQIVGKAYAASYEPPTPSNLTTAVSNMEDAYTDAAGRPTPDFLELGTGNIGGKTLAPGLYKWTSTVTIPTDVTISGGVNDTWIFQTTGDLTMASDKTITLGGSAMAKNIFWQVAGHVTIGTGAHFEGVMLCKTDVTLQTGATMNGRVLAQTQVALQKATLKAPAP